MSFSQQIHAERVWLAPMSGSTDAAFRRQVVKFGGRAVVSEMIAGETLLAARPDMVRRMCRQEGAGQWIVQLAARRPQDMRDGAMLLADAGVDVVDINMGCPSRQVTGGSSGSALMREPDLAFQIIDAAIEGAGDRPVTLKMRLGWDHQSLNAPMIAAEAESRGIQLITVHGRTRCQFYKGEADWGAIRDTVDAINLPVIANGDIASEADTQQALDQSGAYGVMIGRAAMGRPWLVGQVSAALVGHVIDDPSVEEQCESLCEQIEDSLSLYGDHLGLRTVRKHVAAAIDHAPFDMDATARRNLRSQLCQLDDASALIRALRKLYYSHALDVAA